MQHEVIIIGGGPAGAACASELLRKGIECLVLDKQAFPRPKLCAGWVSPPLWQALAITPEAYPHTLVDMDRLLIHLGPLTLPLRGKQYALRRSEFDAWLLERSGAPVQRHEVRRIEVRNQGFTLDERFTCRYLVGAAGTRCPVYRHLFAPHFPRDPKELIVTLEAEIEHPVRESQCHLRFTPKKLPGYAWYVPKGETVLNIGIGALQVEMSRRGVRIRRAWDEWQKELMRRGWLEKPMHNTGSAIYYRRQGDPVLQRDRAYIVGDAAGLATRDMAEGILPAVCSGLMAARAIVDGHPPDSKLLPQWSRIFPSWLQAFV
ncbi:FAD-dependent monooxygenase [candidate division KSB1 bacterium]|nr:FAD-dependent monooxygenase [candidate division KSB1 bacterium]